MHKIINDVKKNSIVTDKHSICNTWALKSNARIFLITRAFLLFPDSIRLRRRLQPRIIHITLRAQGLQAHNILKSKQMSGGQSMVDNQKRFRPHETTRIDQAWTRIFEVLHHEFHWALIPMRFIKRLNQCLQQITIHKQFGVLERVQTGKGNQV